MERPRINSNWMVVGTNYEFEIVNLWGTGTGPHYRTTYYELKYTHRTKLQVIEAKKFLALIEDKIIKNLNR